MAEQIISRGMGKRTRVGLAVLTMALTTGGLLTACAGNSSPLTSTASREAQNRGTRMCVINNTSMNLRISWRGYPDARAIPPAGQNCNSGYDSDGRDIAAKLEYEPVSYPGSWLSWNIEGQNFAIKSPEAAVYYTAAGEIFGMINNGNVGTSTAMQTDWLRGDLVRLPDSESSKEYLLNLTNASGSNFAQKLPMEPYLIAPQ